MSGARKSRYGLKATLSHWWTHHKRESLASLHRLLETPVATLMTLLVVALALALPTALYGLLDNAERLISGWEGRAQISLYLREGTTPEQQSALRDQLGKRDDVAQSRLITPAEALDEFRQLSGYGEVLDLLGSNPLPAVIVVTPDDVSPQAVTRLRNELAGMDNVDSADIDLAWVQRLSVILDFGRRLMLALALALGATVLLVIGNTIRLSFESRHNEVNVLKLLGATNAFVRRPFLYNGFWTGLLGGLLACLTIVAFFSWLSPPAQELAQLYGSSFALSGLSLSTALYLLLASTLLGIIGAWLAVERLLRAMEP